MLLELTNPRECSAPYLSDSEVLVKVTQNYDGFRTGDMLTVDLTALPKVGDYVLFEASPGSHAVRRYVAACPVSVVFPALSSDHVDDIVNIRGVVTGRR